MTPVGAILDRGEMDNYARQLAIKTLLLRDYLQGEGGVKAAAAARLNWMAHIERLQGASLIADGTPFFWQMVHRLYLPFDEDEMFKTIRHLQLAAFDSYFGHLPLGCTLELPAVAGSDVVLPRLGVQVRQANCTARLIRTAADALAIEVGASRYEIDIRNVPSELRLAGWPIPGFPGTFVLAVHDGALYREATTGQVSIINATIEAATSLAGLIAKAFSLIETADSVLSKRITSFVKWFVPLKTNDPMTTHNSFSISLLPGVIFLSDAYQEVRLAEAIIHEFGHNELFLLQQFAEVIDSRPDELFYSPWRTDPRPLIGLYHAIYVFTTVLQFYAAAERIEQLSSLKHWCRSRQVQLYHQLSLAVAQVPLGRVAPLGKELLDVTHRELERESKQVGPFDDVPASQRAHLSEWCERHPDLGRRVVAA
jgi:HEXXH motif-containing protein